MRKLITYIQNHLRKHLVSGQFKNKSISGYVLFVSDFKIAWLFLISLIGKDIFLFKTFKIMCVNIFSDIIAFVIITSVCYLFKERLIRIFYKTKHSIYPYPKVTTQQIKFDVNIFKECSLDFKFIDDVSESIFRYEDLKTYCNFYNKENNKVGGQTINLEFTEETKQRFPIIKGKYEENNLLKFFIKRSDLHKLSQQKKEKYKLFLRFVSDDPSNDYSTEFDITQIIKDFNNTSLFPIKTAIKIIDYTEKWLKKSDNSGDVINNILIQTPDLIQTADDSKPSERDLDINEKIESTTIVTLLKNDMGLYESDEQ